MPPLTIPAFMPNAPVGHVAMRHGVLGPVLTCSVACASSAVAIAEAAAAIRRGDLDLAIAGGSEALIVPGVVLAWQALQRGELPPNINGGEVAPVCAMNLVLEPGTVAPALRAAISSSFALGGTNAVLLFTRD